ncbi:Ankyrin repeat domaincontaining protein 13Blike, partial [Caligus rogercresseyi]
ALLAAGASTDESGLNGWSIVQEAVISSVLETRDRQRRLSRRKWIPKLLRRLQDAPDF